MSSPPTAEEDLDEILVWLGERVPEKTAEWLASFKSTIQKLSTLPERCPLAPENGLWGVEELRQLLFREYPSQYRIIYTIVGDTVRVLNIRHGARRHTNDVTETLDGDRQYGSGLWSWLAGEFSRPMRLAPQHAPRRL